MVLRLKGQRSRLGLGLTAIRRGFELYECLLVSAVFCRFLYVKRSYNCITLYVLFCVIQFWRTRIVIYKYKWQTSAFHYLFLHCYTRNVAKRKIIKIIVIEHLLFPLIGVVCIQLGSVFWLSLYPTEVTSPFLELHYWPLKFQWWLRYISDELRPTCDKRIFMYFLTVHCFWFYLYFMAC